MPDQFVAHKSPAHTSDRCLSCLHLLRRSFQRLEAQLQRFDLLEQQARDARVIESQSTILRARSDQIWEGGVHEVLSKEPHSNIVSW